MKKFSILAPTMSVAVASAPAFAETSYYSKATLQPFNQSLSVLSTPDITPQADLSFAFDDTQSLQAVVMTDKQMEETEGAWGAPGAWAGAGIGARSYMGGVAGGNKFTWKGLGVYTAAVAGAVGGPGIRNYYYLSRTGAATNFIGTVVNK